MKPILMPKDWTSVVCPYCQAAIGEGCVKVYTGRSHHKSEIVIKQVTQGQPVPTHRARIDLARDEYPWHEYHEVVRGHNVGEQAERTRVSRQMDVSDWPVPYTLLALQRASAGLSDVRVSISYEGCCDPKVYLEVAGWQA